MEDEDNFISVTKQGDLFMTSYFVEDEDNVGSVAKRGNGHSSEKFYKGNGGYVYGRGTKKTVKKQGTPYAYNGSLYRLTGTGNYVPISATLYNEGTDFEYYPGDGTSGYLRGTSVQAIEYDGTLYEDGGVHTYALYKRVSKNLYAAGLTVSYPNYKKYTGKLYDAGQPATLTPATVAFQSVTALTT